MSLKDQLKTLKENWLLFLIPIVLILLLMGVGNFSSFAGEFSMEKSRSYASARMHAEVMPSPSGDFAPEVKNRLISKTAQLSSEVERNNFNTAAEKLKAAIASTNAYLLNENVNTYDTGTKKEYRIGSYNIKVETSKYVSLVSQLKSVGKVLSFNENAEDITGSYTNVQAELENERKRLQRYNEMLASAGIMEDKINLVDRIFNVENRIKYLEENLANLGKQVSYSTIYVTLSEKRSEFADIEFVKFSALVAGFVGSLNNVISLIITLLPWAVAVCLIIILVKFFKNGKK